MGRRGAGVREHRARRRPWLGSGWAGAGLRAHLTPQALALLAELLLCLLVQTPHLPLVLALSPSKDPG